MLHVVCVNVGNYCGRGADYVNRLYDMVTRNLPEGFEGDFTCFTDSEVGLAETIIARPPPHPGLSGWWNKLALFKRGQFGRGERLLYLDLDTVITGPLDDIANYRGDFAILRDFYRPSGLQSSVMAWPADTNVNIWESFEAKGYPQDDPLGDQGFIEKHVRNPDIWQTLFPGKFVSYKRDARFGIPPNSSVVCFHGRPRPHEVVEAFHVKQNVLHCFNDEKLQTNQRDAVQSMHEPACPGTPILPELSCELSPGMAQNSSTYASAETEGFGTELCGNLQKAGANRAQALSGLQLPRSGDAPSELSASAGSHLALPAMPLEGAWVQHVWKVGGGTSAQLELVGNTDYTTIRDNILRAEAIPDATWLMPCKPHDKVALICAGGPSLNDEIISLAAHAQAGAHVFACNNVPAKLRAHGIRTDFHVIVDARPENAAFTVGREDTTICLYASQCDQSVHRAAGDNLVLWHPAFDGVAECIPGNKERAFIGGGTTCGMKAATIAWSLGYREIHLYGFDSCYREDSHHAYPQSLNDQDKPLDVEYDGKHYKCAPWMIQQAEDFETFGPQLIDHGVRLHVHGSGLIPDIAANFGRGVFRPEAADFRCLAILERLGDILSPRVAEVGVFAGDLSRRLLARRNDLELLMVDSWANSYDASSDDFHASLSPEAQEQYFRLATNVTAPFKDRRTILRMDSKEAANAIPNHSLDLAFIDADHSYEGCKSDLEAYWPKVKPGGILSGHDYANDDWKFGPMVKRAVDEFASAKGLTVDLGENWTYFITKPLEAAE